MKVIVICSGGMDSVALAHRIAATKDLQADFCTCVQQSFAGHFIYKCDRDIASVSSSFSGKLTQKCV